MTEEGQEATPRVAHSRDWVIESDIDDLVEEMQEDPGYRGDRSSTGTFGLPWSAETVALATATAIFSKAFLETLGQRAGDGVAHLPQQARDLVRKRRRSRSGADEFLIGVEGGSAAAVIVTADLPDEACIALLDLDVTADELRGKLLRWDLAKSAWQPAGAVERG